MKANDGGVAGGRRRWRLRLPCDGLLEDGAEAGEFVERSCAELIGHVAADESGELARRRHNGVLRIDG